MEPSEHPSVVVIGAGIVGSAIAMHLAERGLRPLLVDADQDPAGDGTSARSFAPLSAFGADPVGYYELACAALATWPRWAERLGEVGFATRWAAALGSRPNRGTPTDGAGGAGPLPGLPGHAGR
jgi:glycine/D-amino acid oxidase-like deaminating enzyme